jgi:ribonuclease G
MQSAFVDIGLERDAFLYVSDFFEDNDEYEAVVSTVEEKVLKMESAGGEAAGKPSVPSETAPITSAESGAAASAGASAPSSAAPVETRSEGQREGRGDRGGRGRRGRRRRGGRGSTLPDSKFFSPKTDAETSASTDSDSDTEATDESPVSTVRQVSVIDDFMVLPGESLAKYSPGDAHETDIEHDEDEPSAMAAVDAAPPVEAAIPVEHPLAGFGEVSSWLATTPADATPAYETLQETTAAVAEPEPEPTAVDPVHRAETAAIEAELANNESGISAAEVAEIELEQDVRNAELFDANGDPTPSIEEKAVAEELEAAGSESEGEAVAVDEGPEPARIPTSLTATLREQGHRYPHRISRRMRRKMRSNQNAEEAGQQQPSDAAPQRADNRAENRTVSPRREDRDRGQSESREQQRPGRERPERERPPLPSISDLLKEGQEIIVQIAKEPLGQKGARITSHIALPGRFVVYMPTVEHVGVSRKIPSDEERQRLKRILQTHRQGIPGGFICRTAAENKSEEELKSDMHFLYNLWLDMRQKAEKKPAPLLLHHDLDLVQRILRDQLTTSFKTIWVDNEELYESILSFVQRFQPALVGRVKLYTRANPIFDEFGVTAEIEKALRPKVWLKSGGYIVINQTEALVAIDINTGKYVGKSNRLEDTIVKINTDAIKEIVRQIRLRDLGGIIVVDFIDMDERKNRQKVMLALEDCMRADRAPYKILQFNDFGLVAITRKRVKQSLERTLCAPCTYCEGAGYIKSVGTVISEILQEAQKMRKALEAEQTNLMLRVNPEVAKVLKSNHNTYLQEIEETLGKSVLVKSDPQLHQTKFDLA